MSLRDDFIREHPDFPLLGADDRGSLERFLRDRDWLESAEVLERCERAGEGNMNLTLRACTDRRTFIVKQARPWVEKFDHIPAPLARAEVERRFYERISFVPEVAERMPRLFAADGASCTPLLDDLGDARAMSTRYREGELFAEDAQVLGAYLCHLQAATRATPDPAFANPPGSGSGGRIWRA